MQRNTDVRRGVTIPRARLEPQRLGGWGVSMVHLSLHNGGASTMPRVNWVFVVLALVGVGGGAALWMARATDAAHVVWTATTVAAFLPLVVHVISSVRRREPGVDMIAVLAMAGAPRLGGAPPGAPAESD